MTVPYMNLTQTKARMNAEPPVRHPREMRVRMYSVQNQRRPRVAAISVRSPRMAAARSGPVKRARSHSAGAVRTGFSDEMDSGICASDKRWSLSKQPVVQTAADEGCDR